jgi:hypothetical protein
MNEALRKVCRANLLKALERLKQHIDPFVAVQATMAEELFLDFESTQIFDSLPRSENQAREPHDDTDYERYRLLQSFGLSPEQLIDVAKSDGLHDLRIVRMLRLVFEMNLEEATRRVGSKSQ